MLGPSFDSKVKMGKVKKTVAANNEAVKKTNPKRVVKKKGEKSSEKKKALISAQKNHNLKAAKNMPEPRFSKRQAKIRKEKSVTISELSKTKNAPKQKLLPQTQKKSKIKSSGNKQQQNAKGNTVKAENVAQLHKVTKVKMSQEPKKSGKQVARKSSKGSKASKINNKQLKTTEKKNKEVKLEKLQQLNKKRNRLRNHQEKKQQETQDQHNKVNATSTKHSKLNVKKLEQILAAESNTIPKSKKKNSEPQSLRERMMSKLRASRFRYLNESLYNSESTESKKYFKEDPEAFAAYHEGYKQQVDQWPLNPLDKIIASIKKLPKDYIIADFGCGEARLAESVAQKVHSFDLVSLNERVTACDMAHTPLLTNGVNIVVFCLSLMGTNLKDYLIEANRVLKKDGIMKVAEVESRFDKVEDFVNTVNHYGFKMTWKDLSNNLFYFIDFKKIKDISGKKNNLPQLTLKPCLYKKR